MQIHVLIVTHQPLKQLDFLCLFWLYRVYFHDCFFFPRSPTSNQLQISWSGSLWLWTTARSFARSESKRRTKQLHSVVSFRFLKDVIQPSANLDFITAYCVTPWNPNKRSRQMVIFYPKVHHRSFLTCWSMEFSGISSHEASTCRYTGHSVRANAGDHGFFYKQNFPDCKIKPVQSASSTLKKKKDGNLII